MLLASGGLTIKRELQAAPFNSFYVPVAFAVLYLTIIYSIQRYVATTRKGKGFEVQARAQSPT